MNFIFYFPQPKIIDIYSKKKNIFFFDDKGLYKIRNKKRQNINLNLVIPNSSLKNINLNEMIKVMSDWGPIWSRFVDRGDQYELYKREILMKSIQIINFIKTNKIKKIIMFTYLSHNIQSLMFDLISRYSNTQQIFFFSSTLIPGNKDNLIAPLLQKKSIKDRHFIKTNLSNFSFKKYLVKKRDILNKTKNQKFSKYKSYYEEYFYSRNFILSFIKIIIYYSYANTRKKFFNFFNKDYLYMDIMHYSLITHLRQIYQQKKSFKYYYQNICNLSYGHIKKSLLILSHTQPEASSYPLGQEWNNHIDIMLELKKKNYKGKIFYKEHATNFNYYDKIIHHGRKGSNRSENYYKNLIALGASMLPHNINIFSDYMLKNFLPVTISGSVAIERSLLGLKTIYFGYPWWKGLPGTVHINEINKLDNIENYFTKSKKISNDSIKFICNKLDKSLIENYPEMHSIKNDHLYTKKIFKNRFDDLLKTLSNS